jgi:LysM repeat protein
VDEADSVLIDEAVTPLIISRAPEGDALSDGYRAAWAFAGTLDAGLDYSLDLRYREVELTASGRAKVESCQANLPALWRGSARLTDLIKQALTAREFFLRGKQYVVQDGDTLFGIALQYGVTIEALAAANKIGNPDMIRPGQTIVIPSASFTYTKPTPAAAPPQPAAGANRAAFQYTIQTGDTLFGLALQYGVTVRAIATANQIADPEFIRPGQTILIPADSPVAAIISMSLLPSSSSSFS